MSAMLALFFAAHGVIHGLGFAKAFRLADLAQLKQSISPVMGCLWLLATILFLVAAGALLTSLRDWWAVAAAAILVSAIVIVPSWSDAKYGMVANAVALAAVVFGFLSEGPGSLRAEYDRDVAAHLAPVTPAQPITAADLAQLPAPVRRYLSVAGVVGMSQVRNVRVRMHGRIRSGPDARWMRFKAEQYNFVDHPARLFYLTASMFGLPVQGYHRFVGRSATMRIRGAALVRLADASGERLTHAETVTLFNDMCVMAPTTLIDPAIVWEVVDRHTVRAVFTKAGQTVRALLSFNDAGELIDFWSDDRYQVPGRTAGAEGVRWSTPLGPYRAFGSVRLASRGEAWWHDREGAWSYIEITIDEVDYNLPPR